MLPLPVAMFTVGAVCVVVGFCSPDRVPASICTIFGILIILLAILAL